MRHPKNKMRRTVHRSSTSKKVPEGRNDYHQALIDLGFDDPDLDRFAQYFNLCFENRVEPITVLVSLLNRFLECSQSTMVDIRNIIPMLNERLFLRCDEGEKAAKAFSDTADKRAALILNRMTG